MRPERNKTALPYSPETKNASSHHSFLLHAIVGRRRSPISNHLSEIGALKIDLTRSSHGGVHTPFTTTAEGTKTTRRSNTGGDAVIISHHAMTIDNNRLTIPELPSHDGTSSRQKRDSITR
mmetsp:Transcript_9841/g.14761  ORF Transcript_9841/g.14761 Transcript_9841/m.14761 type:complete len:121 (-) Transcript_9841:552-914(-)